MVSKAIYNVVCRKLYKNLWSYLWVERIAYATKIPYGFIWGIVLFLLPLLYFDGAEDKIFIISSTVILFLWLLIVAIISYYSILEITSLSLIFRFRKFVIYRTDLTKIKGVVLSPENDRTFVLYYQGEFVERKIKLFVKELPEELKPFLTKFKS